MGKMGGIGNADFGAYKEGFPFRRTSKPRMVVISVAVLALLSFSRTQ